MSIVTIARIGWSVKNMTKEEMTKQDIMATAKAMNEIKDKMDYGEWSQVIHRLKVVIAEAKITIDVQKSFLAAAYKERDKHPKPGEKELRNLAG